jgi:protein ImuB
MNQRIACLWFPNWPIQRRVVSQPELRKQRVVLVERDARRGQLVAAASPLAMHAGVSIGMPLVEAKSLLQGGRQQIHKSQEDLHLLPHQPDQDRESLESIADSLESCSPIVGLESFDELRPAKKHSPESIFMDVTGLAHLFGDEQRLAELAIEHCQQAGYLIRIAIADTLGQAWALARYSHQQSPIVLKPRQFEESESNRCTTHELPIESQTLCAGLPVPRAVRGSPDPAQSATALCAGLPTLHNQEKSTNTVRESHTLCAGLPTPHNQFTAPTSAVRESPAPTSAVRGSPDPAQSVHQLPIESLRLPAEMIKTLHQLGICNIGQLERLPRAELAMRFGHAIGLRLDQLNGQIDEPVIARRLPPEFQRHQSLDFPTRHRETIETIAARLVQQLCDQLRSCQRGALQWRFVLDRVEGEAIEFTIRLFRATATAADILPLLTMHLEQVLQPHTFRARKKKIHKRKPHAENRTTEPSVQMIRTMSIDIQDVTVEVISNAVLAQHQRRLFDENPHADPQAMTALVNRLTSRIGASNVVCASLQANAQPEYSFRLRPLVDVRHRRVVQNRKHSHLFARPLRLFHPPREIRACSMLSTDETFSGTGISRPPALLVYEPSGAAESPALPSSEKVIRTWGPERIETGWWRGRTTCRDYWRVETERGNHFWVFRDLRRRKWFVQGEF